jgi:hypothetical protein
MSTNEAAAPAVDDDYVVKLPSGDARVMSIDELDAALEAGTIHKDSPVLAPGTVTWTTLGVLAGLDDEPALSNASAASAALAASAFAIPSPSSVAPMVMGPTDRDDDDSAVLRPRRRAGKVVVAAFGALAIFAVGFAIKSAVTQTLATRAAEAALAAQPAAAPPPAPVAPPPVIVQAAPPVAPAPPPAAAAAAPAPASASASTKANAVTAKDKKKNKLPGAPSASKKK